MVEVVGVTYHVGGAGGPRILDDVTARFAACKFNAIIGPNGAGKSTLLRVATGLLRPSAGEVRYGDRPVAAFRADELARTRAVLSQHVELAFPLPVEDVVLMELVDIVARIVIPPAELPIGIITAVIGAPIFLWILLRQQPQRGTGATVESGAGAGFYG